MFDLVIRGATVVDGTGAPSRVADVAVSAGRIAAVGSVEGAGTRTIDGDGLVVAPGFIDVHTHYDAQVMWDPAATPSPLHGVTTIIGGNCGFSIAPLGPDDVDYMMQLMSVVEGIPLSALQQGGMWDWHSFGEWLDRLEGRVAVNAAFLVGHSTLRRVVMGADSVSQLATTAQIAQMRQLLHESLNGGALGLSSGWDNVHLDADGNPVPSRVAAADEFIALARVVGKHAGTTLGFFPHMGELPRDRMEVMADMSVAANRPLNWNLLGSMSPVEIYEQQLVACDLAAERGGRVVALALPDFLRMRANTLLDALPEFREITSLDEAQRRAAVRDPQTRARLRAAVDRAATTDFAALAAWDLIEIAEARSADTEPLVGLTIAEVAAKRGVDPIDVLIDVVVPELLPLTVMLPTVVPSLGASDQGWRARAAVWRDSRVLLGGSDAGAHLDLMCHRGMARRLGRVRSGASRQRSRDRALGSPRRRRTSLRRIDRCRARARRRPRDRHEVGPHRRVGRRCPALGQGHRHHHCARPTPFAWEQPMKTPICERLGIEFPIFAFSHCRDVVAAVTNAGGFGVLGALAYEPERLEIELDWIDEHVKGRPYGVDFAMPVKVRRQGRRRRGLDRAPQGDDPRCPSPVRAARARRRGHSSVARRSRTAHRQGRRAQRRRRRPGPTRGHAQSQRRQDGRQRAGAAAQVRARPVSRSRLARGRSWGPSNMPSVRSHSAST